MIIVYFFRRDWYSVMLLVCILFIIGLVLVIKGGDWFVDSAVAIATYSGLPQVFIGATIVSLATTLPELIVSVTAATIGQTTMSVGNGIGSMICNIGLILSISAIFGNIIVHDKHFNSKAILLISYLLILTSLSLDGCISKFDSIILLMMLSFYIYINVIQLAGSTNNNSSLGKVKVDNSEKLKIMISFIVGITCIILGSNLIINNGIVIAEYLKVPSAVVALTLIALGTSLPELVTGITSLIKGNEEIGLGNMIGANILNAVLVIGASSFVENLTIIPQNLCLDLPVAILLTVILLLPTVIKRKVTKAQGLIMITIYFAYILYMWSVAL